MTAPEERPAAREVETDVRIAFEAWWCRYGYTPPDDSHDAETWNAYHVRYGLAWMGFAAGWKARP